MSADHVPEIHNREEQLAELNNILTGHAAFGRLRGTLNGTLHGFVDDCIDQGNPSAALRAWDGRVADLRVMLNLLAKFRRDGWTLAEMELKRALTDRKYILPGETVPLEATTPYTVFMVDPELTLAMHQFFQDWRALFPEHSVYGVSRPEFWERYREEAFCSERYGPLLWPLFQQIDLSRAEWGRSRSIFPFSDVVSAFGDRVEGIKTRRVGKRTMEFVPWGFTSGGRWRYVNTQLMGNSRLFSAISCLYGKPEEQSSILGGFSREDQWRIASWQFHLPSVMIGNKHVYAICLRPEVEHARWRKERPQFTSRGAAHGYCAVLVPINSVARVFKGENLDRLRLFHNSRIFDRS